MENSDDQQFDQVLTQLHREQRAVMPEFDTMWSAAHGTVKQRTVRRRLIRVGIVAAVCLLVVVSVQPWSDHEKAGSKPAIVSIDFARLHQLIEAKFETPRWTEPSPTQFLVELSPQPELPSYQLLN